MTRPSPLSSLAEYGTFLADLLHRASVEQSTLKLWPSSSHTGIAEGEIFFRRGVRLRVREELDFASRLITSYGYEVYEGSERLFWYDDFPHPQDPALSSTLPHHKHIPPNIKRNRIPAPRLSFLRPNLPALLIEVEALLSGESR